MKNSPLFFYIFIVLYIKKKGGYLFMTLDEIARDLSFYKGNIQFDTYGTCGKSIGTS